MRHIILILGLIALVGCDPNLSESPNVVPISSYENDLKTIMDGFIEDGLVKSYNFSDERVVYIDSEVWYFFPVVDKKNFLLIIKSDLEKSTGYHRFKVRDYRSNEVLAEVTAFSGSIEIYK